jgi:hypothetical protein
MNKLEILHIAPINTSGVPGQFVQAEREMGHKSRLVTLFKDDRDYFEDVCLNLPFINFAPTKWIKKHISHPQKLQVSNKIELPEIIPPVWTPFSKREKYLVKFRDFIWSPIIEDAIMDYDLNSFDIIQLDGGLGFYRDSRFIREMKALGKKIICCYTGSDLRTRGVIPQIDRMSDLNVSVEFDHLLLHPNIHHIFFPVNVNAFKERRPTDAPLTIGHAPTNRKAKGSDIIIPVLHQIKQEYKVEIKLIENMPFEKAIIAKQSCDIFVDQIGDLGYGINSLESLAMGIATCSCLAAGFEKLYPNHPFIVVDEKNIKDQLVRLIKDHNFRQKMGNAGREWVIQNHNAKQSVKHIHKLAGIWD